MAQIEELIKKNLKDLKTDYFSLSTVSSTTLGCQRTSNQALGSHNKNIQCMEQLTCSLRLKQAKCDTLAFCEKYTSSFCSVFFLYINIECYMVFKFGVELFYLALM